MPVAIPTASALPAVLGAAQVPAQRCLLALPLSFFPNKIAELTGQLSFFTHKPASVTARIAVPSINQPSPAASSLTTSAALARCIASAALYQPAFIALYLTASAALYHPTSTARYHPTSAALYLTASASLYQPAFITLYQPASAALYQPASTALYQPAALARRTAPLSLSRLTTSPSLQNPAATLSQRTTSLSCPPSVPSATPITRHSRWALESGIPWVPQW